MVNSRSGSGDRSSWPQPSNTDRDIYTIAPDLHKIRDHQAYRRRRCLRCLRERDRIADLFNSYEIPVGFRCLLDKSYRDVASSRFLRPFSVLSTILARNRHRTVSSFLLLLSSSSRWEAIAAFLEFPAGVSPPGRLRDRVLLCPRPPFLPWIRRWTRDRGSRLYYTAT